MTCDEFRNWCNEKLKEWHSIEIGRPLYHYTTSSGLDGIIRSRKMRFTSIFHLADPSELNYGTRIAKTMLRKDSAEFATYPGRYFSDLLPRMLDDSPADVHRYYVASLSEKRNDLGQWRSYADNGRGFMIGLVPKLFEELQTPKSPTESYFVCRVDYDRANVTKRLREVIRIARRAIMATKKSDDWRRIAAEAAFLLLITSVAAKHEKYSIEGEVRLVLANELRVLAPYIETRTRGSSLVPFVPCELLKYSPSPLSEIMIGPAGDVNANDAVRQLLAKPPLFCRNPPIVRSRIPYRAV